MHELLADLNKADGPDRAPLKAALVASGALLGLLQQEPESWLKGDAESSEIEALVAARNAARAARDFAEADRIRAALAIRGVVLEDGPGGTTWRRAG